MAIRKLSDTVRMALSGLHTANLSWQTRVGKQTRAFTRQTHAKSQRMLNLEKGRRSAVALT